MAEVIKVQIINYAERLNVPEDFLRELGLMETTAHGNSIKIPYYDETGAELSSRFLIALDGYDRHRVKKGDQPGLYGLNRLNAARTGGDISIVIGESDCIALWWEGIPAIGLPTPASWNEARDARYFDGFRYINVIIHPSYSDAVLNWLRHSSIRERAYLVSLPGDMEPAALRLANTLEFEQTWKNAIDGSVSWTDYAKKSELEAREVAKRNSAHILANPDILEAVADQCAALGVAGERRIVKLAYLVGTTRIFSRPVSLIIKGPSAVGKSFILKTVLRLFPEDAHLDFTGMSEKALIHTPEPLVHRMLVIYEAAGLKDGFQAYIVRSLLSEGHIRYHLPNRIITKQGPTGLFVTTTADSLHHENETRCFSVAADDSPEQTARVIRQQANMRGAGRHQIDPQWHALQHYLAISPHRVTVPFEKRLSGLVQPVALRLRRDFNAIYTLVRAHAILHQESRDRDRNGAIVANIDDYTVVRDLVNDIISEGAETKVSEPIRKTYQTVVELIAKGGDAPSLGKIAATMKMDKSTVSRNVTQCELAGYLRKPPRKSGQTLRVMLGDELPTQNGGVLPEPGMLERGR